MHVDANRISGNISAAKTSLRADSATTCLLLRLMEGSRHTTLDASTVSTILEPTGSLPANCISPRKFSNQSVHFLLPLTNPLLSTSTAIVESFDAEML